MEKTDYMYEHILSNQNMSITNTPYHLKLPVMSNEKELLEERDNRPVNSHYHPDKGYKFDVMTEGKDKYVIENERLGDVDVLPNPLVTLFR